MVFHIYYEPSSIHGGEYLNFRGFKVRKPTADPKVAKDAVKDDANLCRETMLLGVMMPVGYSDTLKGYYILNSEGKRRHVVLIKDDKEGQYYFHHPELNESLLAHFPIGALRPTSPRA